MAVGVWLHLTEHHEHEHFHKTLAHAHPHVHDEHHRHSHGPGDHRANRIPTPMCTRHFAIPIHTCLTCIIGIITGRGA